jgi:hypothetical protein
MPQLRLTDLGADQSDASDSGAEPPPSPVDALEASVIFRLEKSLFALRHAFVREFQSLLDDSLGFEKDVNVFISQITSELKEILKPRRSSEILADPPAVALPAFDGILGDLPRKAGGALQEPPFDESALAPARALLADLVAERGALAGLRAQADEGLRARERAKAARLALEAREAELGVEAELVARRRERLPAPEPAPAAAEESGVGQVITAVIEHLRRTEAERPSLRLAQWSETTAQQIHGLGLVSAKIAAMAETVARSIQLFESHAPEPDRTAGADRKGELADVEQKLAQIRRRRVEVMRDVDRMMDELTSE